MSAGSLPVRLAAGRLENARLMRDYLGMAPPLSDRFDARRDRAGLPAGCDIHSLRPWFVLQAKEADQPANVIAAVVGVRRRDELQSHRPSWADLCACVESVTPPAGC